MSSRLRRRRAEEFDAEQLLHWWTSIIASAIVCAWQKLLSPRVDEGGGMTAAQRIAALAKSDPLRFAR